MTPTPITVTLRQLAKRHLSEGELSACLKLCDARRAFLRNDPEAADRLINAYHRETGKVIAVRMRDAA
ncbi:hypothetical protein [Phaeobacter sp. 22II1-1F12B]|uniref:hypothetical protein n=1 Tax=Phaeobacter sp. 22II1-1F12B TaxID=1317111 RepID=UPI000B51F989|nr:hypothetical protein [Phaeobacter sp. 22II1-1F12B]OWU80449.1 hypothetical protein ATO1_08875 [Phaeobacter sp. 22II1-1F12B]